MIDVDDYPFPSSDTPTSNDDHHNNNADAVNNVQTTMNMTLDTRDAVAMLERLKIIAPIFLIFFVKWIMENMVQFFAVFTICTSVISTKTKFAHLLSLKLFQLRSISVVLLLTLFESVLLYMLVMYCGIHEPLWQRLVLLVSSDPDLSMWSNLWKCFIVDMFAQLLVLDAQVLACFVYVSCFFYHQSSANGRYSSLPSPPPEDVESNVDTRHGELNRRSDSRVNRSSSIPPSHSRSNSSASDLETKFVSELYLGQKRLCLVVAVLGLAYRSLLPVRFSSSYFRAVCVCLLCVQMSVWWRYFRVGFGSRLFPSFYLVWKMFTVTSYAKALAEALRFYFDGTLEFGHYATAEESTQSQDCPVCFDRPYKPVCLGCSHVFCEHCIYEWLDKEKTCPVCRGEVRSEAEHLGPMKDHMQWSLPTVI